MKSLIYNTLKKGIDLSARAIEEVNYLFYERTKKIGCYEKALMQIANMPEKPKSIEVKLRSSDSAIIKGYHVLENTWDVEEKVRGFLKPNGTKPTVSIRIKNSSPSLEKDLIGIYTFEMHEENKPTKKAEVVIRLPFKKAA